MRTTVTVVGGGQAGLAMSHGLSRRGIDHVVLEKGEVASAWRTQRWDSLRLLTPNWLTTLTDLAYEGDDPAGFMSAADVADYLDRYRARFDVPVRTGTSVTAVRRHDRGFRVDTDQGPIDTDTVVVATGACGQAAVPSIAASLPAHLDQVHTMDYRRPGQLDDGPVLVVGASASGVQLADELVRSGREVVVAVGDHVRLPRRYRGHDIHWWMDRLGLFDERIDEVDDPVRARAVPSAQLVGSDDHRSLGFAELQAAGVQLVGRLAGVTDSRAQFSGALANHLRSADLKQGRLLDRIDELVDERGWHERCGPVDRPSATPVPDAPTVIDWRRFRTVLWATGYRPHNPWLDPALLDRKGRIAHDGGVMREPGMYVLGLTFLRRRSSSFVHGAARDAEELAGIIAGQIGAERAA